MRKAANLLRERIEPIARNLTQEQGKPLAQARLEVAAGADIVDWFAGEAQRMYGRVIAPRVDNVVQTVIPEPVGPVAGMEVLCRSQHKAFRTPPLSLPQACVRTSLKQTVRTSAVQAHPFNRLDSDELHGDIVVPACLIGRTDQSPRRRMQVRIRRHDPLDAVVRDVPVQAIAAQQQDILRESR